MSKRDTTRARAATQHPRASRNPKPERAISLRQELAELAAAVEGARQLSSMLAEERASNAEDHRAAPGACAAILAIVGQRMRLVDGVLARDLDPWLLRASFNTTAARPDIAVEDVLLELDRSGKKCR